LAIKPDDSNLLKSIDAAIGKARVTKCEQQAVKALTSTTKTADGKYKSFERAVEELGRTAKLAADDVVHKSIMAAGKAADPAADKKAKSSKKEAAEKKNNSGKK
jgi:hypothetical protein